jgi:uncharacterized protein VirK/YbjX
MFISSFVQMARQKYYWSSPKRLGRIMWSLASNVPRQLEIFRILSLPLFQALILVDSALPFKYLSTKYVIRGLPASKRARCFIHHFRFVRNRLPYSFLRQRQQREITIFETRHGAIAYAVTLGFPPKNANLEGELRLQLLVDGVQTQVLQFTVVPGWALQSNEKDVVFIQRLQGMKGCYQQIRSATKALKEVAPPALLVASLQGLADAWGIREMAGISARSQYCYDERCSTLFTEAYDDFFVDLGCTPTTADFFSGPLPVREKPVEQITNGHKARTRKKRAFKLQIAAAVCQWMTANAPVGADELAAPARSRRARVRSRESSAA